MQNKKRGKINSFNLSIGRGGRRNMKRAILLVTFVLFLVLFVSTVSASRLPTVGGDTDNWGTILNDYLTQIAGPNATTLNITGNAEITGDLHMGGALTHDSPVEIREGLSLTNESNFATFTIYNAHGDVSNVSDAFANALIFQSDEIDNPNNMEVCFWDKENQIMFFCISEGGPQKATTVRRSFQIIGNLTAKENDENFTLCEGANYADCQTDTTGADLLVQDDIEAQSIYANENFQATGNLTLGQKITFTLGEIIDNIVDGWIRITGNLNVTGNATFNERVGIGTTTPDEILHLFGNSAALKLEDDSGNNATIKVGNSQLTLSADPDNAVASTDIVFKMDGSEVARFYQGGNFGIGTITTGGAGQLSLGADSEEGCFRYNSNKDGLEFSHQCDNNFSLISDAGFYGSLKWDTTTNCRWSLETNGPPYQTYPADTQCDDNERTAYGLTTSNVSVGNAEGQLPQIKFDSMPAGTYLLKATGQFATDGATSSDCGWMFTTGSINSTHTGFAGSGAARSSTPEIDGILHVPTDLSATTITIFIAESGGSDTCDIIVTATDIEQAELEISVYYYPQYNSTTGADYAEWFEKENELILAGDLIGLNIETGKVRVWRYADPIVGIASNNPSVTGNYKPGIENTHALVGLVGQLDLNEPRIIIKESVVYSPDGQFIGYKLSNGKVFIK